MYTFYFVHRYSPMGRNYFIEKAFGFDSEPEKHVVSFHFLEGKLKFNLFDLRIHCESGEHIAVGFWGLNKCNYQQNFC